MLRNLLRVSVAGIALISVPTIARASTIVLTFEGLRNLEQIANYYDGGWGGSGSGPGPSYGIVFGSDSLALIDADAGGTGNIANEPSASTAMIFLTGIGDVMNVAAGFDTGFSFFFSANPQVGDGSVSVYDGLNGTGNLLASLTLDADLTPQFGCGGGDPNGSYSCWAAIGVLFAGTAKSVIFGGNADFIAFDNITLGSDVPGGAAVPEPTTMLLLGSGVATLVARRRMTRKAA